MTEKDKSKSKTTNRIFLIGGVTFAIALTVAGVIAINQSKEKGTADVLANESELTSMIYDTDAEQTKPLSDEQFYVALTKLFPKDQITETSKREMINRIETAFSEADITAEVSYFNNYGKPGYRISTTSSVNDILPLLDYSLCSEYVVQVTDIDGVGILGVYKITSDGVTVRMEQGMSIGTEESLDNYLDFTLSLKEQYGIEKITLTDTALLVYSYDVSTADLLNAFDYVYQWCLGNDCDRQIFLYASDRLVIVTNPSLAEDFYKKNYPVQELAAIFRLNYYSAECFFGQVVQDTCNLYL